MPYTDVRARDRTPYLGYIANIALHELSRTRPTFGSMPRQTDDIVALAEQSGDNTATDHSARPGDGDSHWLTSNLIG